LEAETAASASAFSAASIALSSDSGILGMLVCPAVVTGRGGARVDRSDAVAALVRLLMCLGRWRSERSRNLQPALRKFSACAALSKKPGHDLRCRAQFNASHFAK
jgi:hypothetical protein